MRGVVPKRSAAGDSRELNSFEVSLVKVRLLHYAAQGVVTSTALLRRLGERGCEVSAGGLSPILAHMVRRGWFGIEATRAKTEREYLLTKRGHQVLNAARKALKKLASMWTRTNSSNGCEVMPQLKRCCPQRGSQLAEIRAFKTQ